MRRTFLAAGSLAVAAIVGVLAVGVTPARAADASTGWAWPLPPPHTVVQRFAPPSEPWLPGQRGVDLAGHPGEIVHAAGAGVVRYAGRVAGMPVVSITHPDRLVTTYEPVQPTVRIGEPVRRGQPIGHLQLAGSQCAPRACLHWGLLRGTDYLDPLALVGAGVVRLLPFGASATGSSSVAVAAGTGAAALAVIAPLARRRRERRCRQRLPP